jgi:hypothetical protein
VNRLTRTIPTRGQSFSSPATVSRVSPSVALEVNATSRSQLPTRHATIEVKRQKT